MLAPVTRRVSALAFSAGLAVALSSCFVATAVGGAFGADSSCDRRFGASKEPAPFCQEIEDTVAGSEFREDCSTKLQGKAAEEGCPRDKVLGGCRISKENDDGSVVTDWYYDVRDLVAAGKIPESARVKSTEEVRVLCADPKRYEDGATFVPP
jgi:hypothetical protein